MRRMETRTAAGGGSGLDLYVELVVPRGRGERLFLRGLRKWRDARSAAGSGSGSSAGISATLGQGPSDSGAHLRLYRAEDEVLYDYAIINKVTNTIAQYNIYDIWYCGSGI